MQYVFGNFLLCYGGNAIRTARRYYWRHALRAAANTYRRKVFFGNKSVVWYDYLHRV